MAHPNHSCADFPSIENKGRAVMTLAKGPSRKRKREEFEAVKDELAQLKEDRWGYVNKVKRMRQEYSGIHD